MGTYRELAPWPALTEHVACVWHEVLGPGEPAREVRVLPDACVDVVWEARGLPVIAGPDTGPVVVRLEPGATFAGVRFRPGRAPDLLGVAAHELRDAQPELAAVWGAATSRRLVESGAAGSVDGMLAALQAEVATRLQTVRRDRCAPAAVDWARRHAPLRELAGALGVSERQLRRRIEERFGYGPMTLRRVLRLQRLLALAAQRPLPLAELALAAGYADQAHMTRESVRLAGLTPVRLLGVPLGQGETGQR